MKRFLMFAVAAAFLLGTGSAVQADEGRSPERVCDVIEAEIDSGVLELNILTNDGETRKVYIDVNRGSVINARNVSLDKAMEAATRKVPGVVSEVEYERGRYEVKINRTEGGRAEVYVDAATGEVVEVK